MSFLKERQLYLLFICLPIMGLGQVFPPEFVCVINDTLTWEPAVNNCGTFNAYEVYGSTSEQGPYTLLSNETDVAQTTFFHADVNNQTWYYYLATNANCPGEMQLYSDTLDNLIPLAGPIQNVTIVAGGVEINWNPSPSPEVYAYVVSRNTQSGTTELDTVFGGITTYLDTSADPENISEVYYVVAIDQCGNKSLVVDPHSTILLEVVPPDACSSGVVLNWNPYLNWGEGVDHYEIFVSVNGGLEMSVGQADGSSNTFTYMEANDGENLCFRVEAVEANTLIRSRSSTGCTDVSILQPIREIELLGATVNLDGSVDLEWLWDETALITTSDLLSYRLGDDVVLVDPLVTSSPLSSLNTYTSTNVNAQSSAYNFNVDATDDCGNIVTSNDSQSPFLTATSQGETSNQLVWDMYNHELATNISYELVRGSGASEQVIFTGSSTDVKYTDEINGGGETGVENCYYLRVFVEYTLSDGQVLNRILRSNTVCLAPTPQVYVPNAFAPNGVNQKFRPFLSFDVNTTYSMDIFDRWGAHVFKSEDINLGWDGKRNGELMTQGIYLYIIEIQLEGREVIKTEGDVLLLH